MYTDGYVAAPTACSAQARNQRVGFPYSSCADCSPARAARCSAVGRLRWSGQPVVVGEEGSPEVAERHPDSGQSSSRVERQTPRGSVRDEGTVALMFLD